MVMRSASWGPEYSEQACRMALAQAGLRGDHLSDSHLCEKVAGELSNGRLVFWFQGRMEWRPRALGNRSLLADPRRDDMRALINAKVKLRELFRPFAPSVPEERASDYFDLPGPSPLHVVHGPGAIFSERDHPCGRPCGVHVDGSTRVQTVDADSNPRYRLLLEAFGRRTGVPMLLNTSLM